MRDFHTKRTIRHLKLIVSTQLEGLLRIIALLIYKQFHFGAIRSAGIEGGVWVGAEII